jgi:hypothetical protein
MECSSDSFLNARLRCDVAMGYYFRTLAVPGLGKDLKNGADGTE